MQLWHQAGSLVQLEKYPFSAALSLSPFWGSPACASEHGKAHAQASRALSGAGLLSVSDNGVGMTKQELTSWAVMNLSMEDRGLKPQEAEEGPGLGRFLSGNLSYFGVSPALVQQAHGQ